LETRVFADNHPDDYEERISAMEDAADHIRDLDAEAKAEQHQRCCPAEEESQIEDERK
jgi:hypothetical protein